MISAIGERGYSAQETTHDHMLLSLPLVSYTYSFITLSLTGSHRIMTHAENILQQSLYYYYSNCTTHLTTSFLLFASEFSIYKGEIRKCTSPVTVCCFPRYSCNPQGENYGLYCKYQLIKYKPWQTNPSTIWGEGDGSTEI